MNMMQILTQIKSNPQAVLSQYGIPQDIASNPQAAIQHLMNTGRVSQAQYDRAVSMAQSMGMNKK